MWSSNRRKDLSGRSPDATELGTVLDRLLGQRPLRGGMALGVLARRWEEVVGARLAEECSPAALEGGVLLVMTSSQAWGAQIKFLSEAARAAAARVVGEGVVKDVRVTVRIAGVPGKGGAR